MNHQKDKILLIGLICIIVIVTGILLFVYKFHKKSLKNDPMIYCILPGETECKLIKASKCKGVPC